MKVNGKNVSMVRGDSESVTVFCRERNEDGTYNQIPFVTGDTIYLTVKARATDTTPVFQKTITEFTDGKAIVDIEPSDTKDLTPTDYVYDVQWTKADNTVKTIIPKSKFTIEIDVT